MYKNRNVFVCARCGWEIVSDGEDGGPARIQYRPDGRVNGYYDRDRPEQALSCVIEALPDELPEKVSLALQNFDASAFVWTAAKEYEAKYETVPPVVSFADFVKQLFSALEKLCRALEGNQSYDAFEEKMAEAASSCGLDMMIERGHRIDTLRLEGDGASLSATLYKTYSDEEDAFVSESDAKRAKDVWSDISKDAELAEKRLKNPLLSNETIHQAWITAKKGLEFLSAMRDLGLV